MKYVQCKNPECNYHWKSNSKGKYIKCPKCGKYANVISESEFLALEEMKNSIENPSKSEEITESEVSENEEKPIETEDSIEKDEKNIENELFNTPSDEEINFTSKEAVDKLQLIKPSNPPKNSLDVIPKPSDDYMLGDGTIIIIDGLLMATKKPKLDEEEKRDIKESSIRLAKKYPKTIGKIKGGTEIGYFRSITSPIFSRFGKSKLLKSESESNGN